MTPDSAVLTPETADATVASLAALTPRQALDRAVDLHQAGHFKASIPYYIHAVQRDVQAAKAAGRPVDPDILHASGVALAMGGKRTEAIEFLESALLNGKQRSAACWSALGLVFVETRQLGKAERCYRMACQLDPRSAANWIGFGNLAYAGGNPKVGERRYERAMTCAARDPEELIAQGMTYLRWGHWRKGWRGYEARRLTAMWADRNPHVAPLRADNTLVEYSYWRAPEPGDHVLVLTEQGLGDAVQFARYVPVFRERFGVTVTLQCHDQLLDLMRGALPDVPILGRREPLPTHVTGWAMILSLPAILHEAHAKDVPPAIRPFGQTYVPRGTSQGTPTGRVFVHSRGNAQHGYDQIRSAPGTLIQDTIRAAGYDVVEAAFTKVGEGGTSVLMAEPSWQDTVDTLLTVEKVVTVDTGLCHVAGSLGVPMELFVPNIPEWRWGRPEAERTPWYPSARLWHRTHYQDWPEALARMLAQWRTEGFTPTEGRCER